MNKEKHLFWKEYNNWIELYKKGAVRRTTYDKYELVGRQLKEKYPDLYIEDITRTKFQQIVNAYGDSHSRDTTKYFREILSHPLRQAFYDGLIKRDPTYKVITASTVKPKKVNKYLDEKEVERFIKVLKRHDDFYAKLFDFDLRTGLRFAEVFGLTPKDVDFDKHLININKTWDYKFDTGFAPTKNKSSERTIIIDQKAERDLWQLIFGVKQDESIFLNGIKQHYINRLNKPLPKTTAINSRIRSQLRKYCIEANVPVISFHKLRHTHASLLIAKGVSIQSVADRLGHDDTNTTSRFYIHLLQSVRERENNQAREILNEMGGKNAI